MATNRIYQWGIIGLGKIAHKFAKDLQQLPNAKLKAVASSDEERAKAFAKEYDAPLFFDIYDDILTAGIDIVYIALPNHLHCEWSIKCLDKKIAVLVEKPFAINSVESNWMKTAAINNQTFLMEAMWTRFLPTTNKLLSFWKKAQLVALLL